MMATPCLAQKIAPFSGLRAHGSQAVRVPEMGENAWHFFIDEATSDQEAKSRDAWPVSREEEEKPQWLKPQPFCSTYGTAEAVP
jgi:hypothetical protein